MARIARVVIPDVPHHITQRGIRGMDIFFQDEDYVTYKEILNEQCSHHDTKIISYCLMTNHVHLIAVPGDTMEMNSFMMLLK